MENVFQALVDEIECKKIFTHSQLSHHCFLVETDKGKFFVKKSACPGGEAYALTSIQKTQTVKVPTPFYVGEDFLILEYFDLRGHTSKEPLINEG